MPYKPVHQRTYHIFISHSSKDKDSFVTELYEWLSKIANLPAWIDSRALTAGSHLTQTISDAIPICRSVLIIVSNSSIESQWVNIESGHALAHQKEFPEFRIIPARIDDSKIPEELENLLYIDAKDNQLDRGFYYSLLNALYPLDPSVQYANTTDIFVSRTWRSSESKFADQVCWKFMQSDFRLIGDSKDHPSFSDSKERVQNIISSCGGMLVILPYREGDTDREGKQVNTSKYCLDEIDFALQFGLPVVVIAEPGVALSKDKIDRLQYFKLLTDKTQAEDHSLFNDAVETMLESWKPPKHEHYVFFATNFQDPDLNQLVCQLVQQITGMTCRMGEYAPQNPSVQEAIAAWIRQASLVIADVSEDNINSLIEAGIARGANVETRLIARVTEDFPRKRPPFMFRDKQVAHYKNDIELLGRIHAIVYPFRRRILNREIQNPYFET